jgi:hypothetical protein
MQLVQCERNKVTLELLRFFKWYKRGKPLAALTVVGDAELRLMTSDDRIACQSLAVMCTE